MNPGRVTLISLCALCLLSFTLLGFFYHGPHSNTLHFYNASQEDWIVEIIPPGGSIFAALEKQGLPPERIGLFSYYFGNFVDVTTIQPGDTLKLLLNSAGDNIRQLEFVQEPTTRHQFTAQGDSLAYKLVSLPVQIRERLLRGSLQGTLDASLLALGLDPTAKQQINNGLETDVNFARDARNGDSFEILVQERVFEGKPLSGSKILYVRYAGERTGEHELFRYEDPAEKSVLSGLYTTSGKNNGGAGVGYPLASIHVVSAFGNRIDPYHRGWAFHQGVDYRARHGTPVYAVANGTVVGAGYNGGWGNEIKIRHASGLITQYAHLSSMNVRRGQSVGKGQIIGRVGSTGRSTGAHLHFGLISGKGYINPGNLKMVGAEKLDGKRMQEFKLQMQAIRARLAAQKPTT